MGEGQSIGNPLTFGGPYVGLFATRQKYIRQMPGRLCGETVDAAGRRGFVLTLSTREQHIRRDKATSNICTNSGLCALAFSIHMTLLGETGLQRLAAINHANAVALAESLSQVPGVSVLNDSFFNEFTIRLPRAAAPAVEALAAKGVLGGVPVSRLEPERPELADLMVVASTEINFRCRPRSLCRSAEGGAVMPRKFDDVRTDESRGLQAYLILIGLAVERKTITYGLLAERVGFRGAGVFAGILGHVMHWCKQNDLPALTALVVGSDTGKPGSGLTTVDDREAAREKVFEFNWYSIIPPSGEELAAAYSLGLAEAKEHK